MPVLLPYRKEGEQCLVGCRNSLDPLGDHGREMTIAVTVAAAIGGLPQINYFKLPSVTPATIWRWNITYTATMGRVMMVRAAKSS